MGLKNWEKRKREVRLVGKYGDKKARVRVAGEELGREEFSGLKREISEGGRQGLGIGGRKATQEAKKKKVEGAGTCTSSGNLPGM